MSDGVWIMNSNKSYAASLRIIDALDMAFGGHSQWGPEELALATVGHIANQNFPRTDWYAPIEALASLHDDGLPDGWDARYTEAFNAEMTKRAKRRFANAEL